MDQLINKNQNNGSNINEKDIDKRLTIVIPNLGDVQGILELYQLVIQSESSLVRGADEVNEEFIRNTVKHALTNGLIVVAKIDGKVLAVLHGITPPIKALRHVLTHLASLVHPKYRPLNLAKAVGSGFFEKIKSDMPHIYRVELMVKENNPVLMRYYKSIWGFEQEGRYNGRILNEEGQLESAVQMVWYNPSFDLQHVAKT